MATILDNLFSKSPAEIRDRGIKSLNWFRENLRNIRVPYNSMLKQGNFVSTIEFGKLYMFVYDAKHKEKLPYWDFFPLTIPYKPTKNGFYGINLHYIRPRDRVVLLDSLYQLINADSDSFDVSYDLITKVSSLRYAKPCIKRYITTHIDSRISEVPREYWELVAMLPSQQFNINANTVYKESRGKY